MGLSSALAHRAKEGVLASASVLLLAAALTGCGGTSATSSGSSRKLVARIGDTAIDRAELEHWAGAIERGSSVATALGKMTGTPRQRALEFLISASWVLGEAQEQGVRVSKVAVEHALQQEIEATPNGRPEFEKELASTGQGLADVKLEVGSTLAAAKLRDVAAEGVPRVKAAEVNSYYSRHRWSFYLPDRRVAYLIEGIPDHTHALAIARQVRPSTRLTRPWFREIVSRSPGGGDRGQLVDMIFATTPGRVVGPVMFNGRWVLAVVRKLIPAGIQPLALVRDEVLKILVGQRRERALKRFVTAFVRKWSARTSCSPAYVIQKCSQYRGALVRGNPLTGG